MDTNKSYWLKNVLYKAAYLTHLYILVYSQMRNLKRYIYVYTGYFKDKDKIFQYTKNKL